MLCFVTCEWLFTRTLEPFEKLQAEEFMHNTACWTPCGRGGEAIDGMACQKLDREEHRERPVSPVRCFICSYSPLR